MALNPELLRSSFALVIENNPALTTRFYELLFERYPQAKPLFTRNTPEVQQKMLGEALGAVLAHLEDASWLTTTLKGMGTQHEGYGVTREMYDWVGECLIAAMSEAAGDAWTGDMTEAWAEAYGAICSLMWAGYEA